MYKFYNKSFVQPPSCAAKILLTMKITTLLLITVILQVSASSFAQKITLSAKDASINVVFNKISAQCGYDFLVNQTILNTAKPVSIEVKNMELKDVLEQIFTDQPLEYEVIDKFVKVKVKEKSFFRKIADALLAKDLHGQVYDEDGKPMAGASVVIVETGRAVLTNENGAFFIQNVEQGATLRFSYIGYVKKDIPATGDLSHVVLQVSTSKLDEIKVIAYGTTTERLSTGNESILKAADILKQPVNNILDALVGRVSGLQVTPTSGIGGAAPNVLIRGRSSLGSAANTPLYILDGVPITASQPLSNGQALDGAALNILLGLNPNDVESISVLKDADATAIYGSRGANGVIIITTKRGKYDGIKVNVNAYTGLQQVGHFIDLLDVHQYNAMRRQAFANDKTLPTAANAPDLFLDSSNVSNWQKEFIGKTSTAQDVNFSLTGGSQNTHFYASVAYHREGSVMPGDANLQRNSFLGTFNHVSADKKFMLDIQSSYTSTDLNLLPQDLVSYINIPPQYQLYNPDGTPNFSGVSGFPLAYTLQKFASPTQNFSGNAKLGYELLPGLSIRLNTGFNYGNVQQSTQAPLSSLDPRFNTSATLSLQAINNGNWIAEPQIEYKRNFKENHFDLLVGSTFQKSYSKSINTFGFGFPSDVLVSNIGSASSVFISSSNVPYAYNSVFGRLTYDFNQEYLANVTFRRDGSSKFGPDRKFGNFGAVGLGWIFSQEKAVTDALPFLSYGKIRGSYGVTGNDQITDFAYIATHNSVSGYNGSAGLVASNIENPDYQWESNKKLEAAIELGFVKDRIILSAAFFSNRSSNQLISYPISTQTGFFNYLANFAATVQNQGMELNLTTRNFQGAFIWSTTLNFTRTKNTLLSYAGIATSSYANTYIVGQPLSIIQAYQITGLSATGAPVFADLDNSGTITLKDRVTAGDKDPMYGGMGNDFSFKGITASFFIQYSRYRGSKLFLPTSVPGTNAHNYSTYVLGRWQQPGDEANTIIPRFSTSGGFYSVSNYNNSVQNLVTNNIFRLSTASIAYSIPRRVIEKLKLSRLQIYANAQNLYTWDKYSKYELDPQTGNSALPPLRTIVFGINATF